MAHHGNFPADFLNQDFRNLFKQPEFSNEEKSSLPDISEIMQNEAIKEGLGATGKYTDGKLGNSDEGEIMFGIAEYEGRIILNFGKPVTWFGLTKEQAKEIGELLIKKAT